MDWVIGEQAETDSSGFEHAACGRTVKRPAMTLHMAALLPFFKSSR
jgi:hypothetical protein